MATEDKNLLHHLSKWSTYFLAVVLLYILSSGPIIAIACWLRESTHNDSFYLVFWIYYPLFVFGPDSLFAHYIEWWLRLFKTVGPG